MADPARADIPPDGELPLDLVGRFARVGLPFTVVGPDGDPVDLHAKAQSGAVIVASGRAEQLRPGLRVSGRIFDGDAALTLVFTIQEIEPATPGSVDAWLQLIAAVARGDERGERRRAYDAPGVAAAAPALAPDFDREWASVRTVEVARGGLSFLSDRRFEVGQSLDLSFEDEAGTPIRARVRVARAERAVYGRTRFAAEITAIGEADQLDLDRLCSRLGSSPPAAEEATTTAPRPEPSAASRAAKALRRLVGRS